VKGVNLQRWMAAGTVVAFSLAGVGAVYACWVLLPALWVDPHSNKTLVAFLVVFVIAFAAAALGSQLRRKGRR
jgi:membrane protein implicated in regulation of membrane protease activity